MAPLPPVPGVVRVRLLASIGGKDDQGLRWFVSYTGDAPSVIDLSDYCGAIVAAVNSQLPAVTSTGVTYTDVIAEDLASSMGSSYDGSFSTIGTEDGDPLPADCAFVTSYEITRRYRGGHARSYWPLGTSTDVDGPQEWNPTSVTAFLDAVNAVLGASQDVTEGSTHFGAQCQVSYYEGFTAVENPLTHRYRNVPTLLDTPNVYAVNSVVGRSYIGSVRRRRLKTS